MDTADPEHREQRRRADLTTGFAGLLTVILAFATVFRPLVSDVGMTFTLIGVGNTTVMALAWWLFASGRIVRHAPALMMLLATLVALPLVLISGGPSSQFAVLVPLFPICGVLLGGRGLAVAAWLFWCLAMPVMFQLHPAMPDITGEAWHAEKAASRTLWLVLASTIALVFALYVDAVARRLQAELLSMTERDPLTGVYNRRGLDAALARAQARAEREDSWVTVMIVDVDFFKRFNDSRGHGEGDMALRAVATALTRHSRAGQDVVARFGGEEFVCVLDGTDPGAAQTAGNKLRQAIRDLGLRYDDASPDVLTATIGFASVRGRDRIDQDELLRRADAALYEGKRRGRDRVVNADAVDESTMALACT